MGNKLNNFNVLIKNRAFAILCLALLSLAGSYAANAESVTLPKGAIRLPPADLLGKDGQVIEVGRAASMAEGGQDLSELSPLPSKIWQPKKYPASNPNEINYPADGSTLQFLNHDSRSKVRFIYSASVSDPNNPKQALRLSISRNNYTALFTAALMRKIGYFIPSPKLYRNIKLSFRSKADLDDFILKADDAILVATEKRGWIKPDATTLTATISHAILEPSMVEYLNIHWGGLPNPKTSPVAVADQIAELARQRSFRAAIVPLVLTDIPESINRYSPKSGSILLDKVILTHSSAGAFEQCTYEDARWAARRILALSEKDWGEILAAMNMNPELSELVRRKLMYRLNNYAELFNLKPSFTIPLEDLVYDSPSGIIKGGIVEQEFVDREPIRVAHGDRESPFEDGDLMRYFKIRGITMGIQTLLSKFNEQLVAQDTGDLYKKFTDDMQRKVNEHIKNKPNEILYRKVESWGGFVGNANVNTNRQITTGTYYGSTAPVQLVDSMSVSAYLGYFRALDGIKYNITPSALGNLSYIRDYVHVRPITKVKAASNESWRKLLVGKFMKNLGAVLARDDFEGDDKENKRHPLDEFLSDLNEGEVFSISDSIAVSAYAQVAAPLDALFGLSPFSFVNSVSLGADANRIVLKQTLFTKTSDGIQVIVRRGKADVYGATFDVNFFLRLLNIRASKTNSTTDSRVYVLDYNAEIAKKSDAKDPKGAEILRDRSKLLSATQALFSHNSGELFEANFAHKRFKLRHKLDTTEVNARLFTQRMINFTEGQETEIVYPKPEINAEKCKETPSADECRDDIDPEKEKVTIFSFRKGNLKGRDFMSALIDIFNAVIKKPGFIASSDNPNPSAVPFGQASWKIVTTESDLTPDEKALPSVGLIQHVWGGWHLSGSKFMDVIDQAIGIFKDADIDSTRIIEKERFATAKQIDFYRISSNISIFGGGLEKVRDLLIQKNIANDKAYPGPRGPFRFLTQIGGRYEARDASFHESLMKIYGSGDKNIGEQAYTQACKDKVVNNNSEAGPQSTGTWLYGTYYECMSPALKSLVQLRRTYPENDKKAQTRWLTNAIGVLEQDVPLPALLKFIGKENYMYFVLINGFRTGDEDGDLEFFSNTSGDPAKDFDTANGLLSLYSSKTRIIPAEMRKTNASFQ